MVKFDLTTEYGCGKAAQFLSKKNIEKLLPLLCPGPFYIYKLGKALWERIVTKPEEQKQAVADLIREGKERGVSEMEITMEDKAGLDFIVKYAEALGVDVDAHVGKNQKIIIKVKYR